jgi:coatomer subunit beta
MWAEFEWENKVAINTSIGEVDAFLDHIVATTNMKCLTPINPTDSELHCNSLSLCVLLICAVFTSLKFLFLSFIGASGYLAANLYAKSVFGEDALVNVSVEKTSDGKLAGYIRIRSKTQGIALSLGDKITLKQKGP